MPLSWPDFGPCANKRSGVFDFCLHFLFILWEFWPVISSPENIRGKAIFTSADFTCLAFTFVFKLFSSSFFHQAIHGLFCGFKDVRVSGTRSVWFSLYCRLLFFSYTLFATGRGIYFVIPCLAIPSTCISFVWVMFSVGFSVWDFGWFGTERNSICGSHQGWKKKISVALSDIHVIHMARSMVQVVTASLHCRYYYLLGCLKTTPGHGSGVMSVFMFFCLF